MKKIYLVKTTDIVKLFINPPEGSEEEKLFGKIFEEEYTFATYLYDRVWNTGGIKKKFMRKIAFRLKKEGIYSKKLMIRTYRIYSALLKERVTGKKPKTRFRHFKSDIYIAAQPDLEDLICYYEFKLYPINDYARLQATIFAWVLRHPVVLVGIREKGDYVTTEKEVIKPVNIKNTLNLPEEKLKEIAQVEVVECLPAREIELALNLRDYDYLYTGSYDKDYDSYEEDFDEE